VEHLTFAPPTLAKNLNSAQTLPGTNTLAYLAYTNITLGNKSLSGTNTQAYFANVNINLGWKCLPGTRTLAYLTHLKKGFKIGQVATVIKLFFHFLIFYKISYGIFHLKV
jgi:hypothetical protein